MVATTIDYKGQMVGWTHGLAGMFVADLKALPDESFTKAFGGATRPTNELIADTISLLNWTKEALKGNVLSGGEGAGMAELTASVSTKESAISTFTDAVNAFAEAFSHSDDETLSKVITAPWGMDAPLSMLCIIAINHIWYHDGQLNYIQALGGDDKVHWMGD